MNFPLKLVTIELDTILTKSLEDFVSNNTITYFRIYGVSPKFLYKDVEIQEKDQNYKKSRDIVNFMMVVNNVAVSGGDLIE